MIKKMIKSVLNLPLLATTTVMAAVSTAAHAQEDIGGLADNLTSQFGSLGKLIGGGAYLGGIFFIAAGIFKLKQAVDSQGQQVKYGDGIWRLALGSLLIALPAVMGVGVGTFFGDDPASTINYGTTFSGSTPTN